jgi:hypothetical protein
VYDQLVGVIEVAHPPGAVCVTVNVVPAIDSVPVRGVNPGLAAALKVTPPDPEPTAPPVMVIHEALLFAIHTHDDVVVTVLLPVPPAPAIVWLVGETL